LVVVVVVSKEYPCGVPTAQGPRRLGDHPEV